MPRRLHVLLPALGAACTVPQEPPRRPDYEPLRYSSPDEARLRGRWGDRWLVEAAAIPAAWLTRDVDGVDDTPDAEDAAGYAARVAVGNRTQSFGVLGQMFHGDDAAFDVATVGLDTDVRAPIEHDGVDWCFVRAGGGVGIAWLDDPVDDPGAQLEAQLRLGLDFQPTDHVLLQVSFGGIVVGHPGETEAYGTFVMIGGGVVF